MPRFSVRVSGHDLFRTRTPGWSLLVGAAGMLALGACDGDTLYDGDPTGPKASPLAVAIDASSAPPRIGMEDPFTVVVTARQTGDQGVTRVGATVLAINGSTGDTAVASQAEDISPPGSGVITRQFSFTPSQLGGARPGASLRLEVSGFAVNAAGACVASVQTSEQRLLCGEAKGARIAAGVPGQAINTVVVAGRTIPISAGLIADAVVDNRTQQLFLSNQTEHQIEVLDLRTLAFRPAVPVGSRPLGLALNRTGDTLIVANSGGSNFSFVPTSTLREDVGRRYQVPRVRLYEIEQVVDTIKGDTTFRLNSYNYADRPQYIAQDARGRLLYSSVPSAAAPVGTLRKAELRPGWQTWDASLLFPEGLLASAPLATHRAVQAAGENDVAIANVDSITLVFGQAGPVAFYTGNVVMYDHVPGMLPNTPGWLIQSDTVSFAAAIAQLHAKGSDVVVYPGHLWNFPDAAEMADTTYVAASGDRSTVVFGEATRTRGGRILLWSADKSALSRADDIRDMMGNASDRIIGVDLNQDGSLGIARGAAGTYFFGSDLRLQGSSAMPGAGGAGAAFRPNSSGADALAFAGTARQTVQVLETTHYRVIGELPIRDNLVGPLRAAAPVNAERACPADYRQGSPDCVVATVYGVTDKNAALVLDVLRRDLK